MKVSRRNMIAASLGATATAITARAASAQDGKVFTLRYQGSHPSNQAFTTVTGAGFRDFVETMSGGRIRFETYDAGAIVAVAGMVEAVDQGILDVGQSYGAFYTGDIPEADIEVGLPLAWENAWEAYDAYYNRGLRDVIGEAYSSRFNVRHFPAIMALTYGVALRDRISSLGELAGKKIRAVGVYGDFVRKLGGVPVVIPGAELYTAMQLGTIDGVLYGAEAVAAANLQDFCNTMIYSPNWNTGAGHWIVNGNTWDALPEDLQNVIEFAAQYGNAAHTMNYAAEEARNMLVLEQAGMTMLRPSDEELASLRDAAQETWDDVAAKSDLAASAVAIVRKQRQDLRNL